MPPEISGESDDPLVLLTTVGDALLAQILAARLEAEGVSAQLKGEFSGPYPMTVGGMAETEVWVPESLMADARLILQDVETHEEASEYEPLDSRISTSQGVSFLWWIAAALLLVSIWSVRVLP